MPTYLLAASILLNVAVLAVAFMLLRRAGGGNTGSPIIEKRIESLDSALSRKFTDLAVQLEKTRGELNLGMAQQLAEGLNTVRGAVDAQLADGRSEQNAVLARVSLGMETKLDQLAQRNTQSAHESRAELAKSLESMRNEVGVRLNDITGQVQAKLDQNIKEGFAHFEKVQEHLKLAEEQLKNVNTLGNSIHDLN